MTDAEKSTLVRRAVCLLLVCVFILAATGCAGGQANTRANTDISAIKSFYDIPGLTFEEVAAIEEILTVKQRFTFGSTPSLDAFDSFEGSAGLPVGFIPQLCTVLEGLFGVPFHSSIYDWQQLYDGLHDHTIDFTSSISKPADMDGDTIHSAPLAGNHLSVFVNIDNADITSVYDLRGKQIGFYNGSYIEAIMRSEFPYIDYESVFINSTDEMADMLQSGEIFAFVDDTADVFEFYNYSNVIKAEILPNTYIPLTVSTANPDLQPIISAVTKFLIAGGITEVEQLYKQSESEYAARIIRQALSEAERDYIDHMVQSGTKIPYGATATRYPVAFFNKELGDYDGIAIDVLREISALTGLEFYANCDENTTWGELEGMLKTGEIALLSQLIPNPARSEYAIWPDTPYFTARYALLSNIDTPFLSINQVPYMTVGLPGGTAEEAKYRSWFPESTNYVTYTYTDDGLSALEKGEIDLFFSLDYTMLYESNYRENPNQKINILFDTPVEPVPFGLNKDEEILCSIISKAQRIINTDRIARSWTSRIVDTSAKEEAERTRTYMMFSISLLVLLSVLLLFFIRSQRLKKTVENQVKATLEANKNLRVLIDLAPVGVIISHRGDGEILYANRSALDMFKCSSFEEDVEGRKSLDFMPEYQSNGTASIDMIRRFWKASKGSAEAECMKKTGEVFTVRLAYRIISYYGNVATLNIIEDMTAEKKQRQMLENIALKEQEANQLKSRFLATMSHEIRTPMNAIIGMAELAMREKDHAVVKDHVSTIKQAGDNLLSILSDILDFSKIEAGKMELVESEYCVASMLHDLVSIIRMRLLNTKVCFAAKVDSRLPGTLYGDETRIRQVALNLLTNATKYTEKGYITLGVYCEFTGDNTLDFIIEVKDTGIGIKPEDMDILFNDFTQLDLEKNKRTEGIGLGLAITRSIVDKMEGNINVSSEYGKSSTFTVRIPQKYYLPEPLAAVDAPEDKKVMIYVKNKTYTEALTYMFANMGVQCIVIKNDADLTKKLKQKNHGFLFISYLLYHHNETVIEEHDSDTIITILTEFGENNSYGGNILNRNISVLTMPVYCNTLADVLNGTYDNVTHPEESEEIVKFTAPEARILIVDDIMSNLKVAEGLLKPYKMHIDLIDSGVAAIDILNSSRNDVFDLIFMDHKMPVMDGVETVKHIRAMGGIFEEIPIIALTANTVSGIIDMFIKNGFNDFISKPIDTIKLNAILEKWIPDDKRKPV